MDRSPAADEIEVHPALNNVVHVLNSRGESGKGEKKGLIGSELSGSTVTGEELGSSQSRRNAGPPCRLRTGQPYHRQRP